MDNTKGGKFGGADCLLVGPGLTWNNHKTVNIEGKLWQLRSKENLQHLDVWKLTMTETHNIINLSKYDFIKAVN